MFAMKLGISLVTAQVMKRVFILMEDAAAFVVL